MDFIDVIKQRYSVRDYKNKAVEQEKLLKVLEAGRLAPSAVNYQPWYFIVVNKNIDSDSFNEVYGRGWFKTAPVVIVVCADHSQSWKRGSDGKDFAHVDAAITAAHMSLMATNLGLGSCWVCNFDVEKCNGLLKLPPHIEPVALLPIGYPNDKNTNKKRKPLKEIVYWGEFEGEMPF